MAKIPKFANEQEEAEFWATHDATKFLQDTQPVDVTFTDARPRKIQIAIRFDPNTLRELRAVAQRRGVGYQTLIRMWVMERLTQEHV
ncbi:MAG: CopG family antitoxin [Anaerolineales bacterium]|nr:CopG family antitoxin [Anaerolineales bacterium]